MPQSSLFDYKKTLLACSVLLVVSIGFGLFGFGYKQIKDAMFLNVDTNKVLVVDGYAEVDTTMDRAIVDFSVTGKGNTPELARKDLDTTFANLQNKLDPKIRAVIVKLDKGVAAENTQESFSATEYYEATIDKFKIEDVNDFVSKVTELPDYKGSVSLTYYTLIEKNGPFKKITDEAIQDAKATAEVIASASGVKLGDVQYVNIGNWDDTSKSYTYNNAKSLYTGYSPRGKVSQTAHITYKLK
jgi:hypothetical protein